MAIREIVNEVKADIREYYIHLRGTPKVGKTQLIYNMFIEKFGLENLSKGALISIGAEDGYKACDGLRTFLVDDWAEFEELREYLIDNKKELGIEMVAIDTSDELIRIACEEIKDRSVALGYTSKGKMMTMNKAFGGFNEGTTQLVLMLTEELKELKKYFGLVTIGHTKMKDIAEKSGEKYIQLTSKLRSDYEYIFASKADVVAVCSIDKEYSKIQVEENNKVKTKAGYLKGAKRKIYFRSDEYNIDCGSRFPDIAHSIDYDPALFLKTIEDAILASKKGKKFTKKEIEAQEKARDERIDRQLVERAKKEEDVNMNEFREIVIELATKAPDKLTDEMIDMLEKIVLTAEEGRKLEEAIMEADDELIMKIVELIEK